MPDPYEPFFAALAVAALLVVLFTAVFKRRGPWGNIWTFFLVLFLGTWAFSIWARPIDAYFYGMRWLPTLMAGVLLAFLLAAVVPPEQPKRSAPGPVAPEAGRLPEERKGVLALGGFFWALLGLLLLVILVGLS